MKEASCQFSDISRIPILFYHHAVKSSSSDVFMMTHPARDDLLGEHGEVTTHAP
jgi:hypothetical protein